MVTNYHTLKALAENWSQDLPGCIVGDAYSQSKDELTLALASPEKTWMVRAATRSPFQYLFRSAGYNKARRNVATLFKSAFDKTVVSVRIADRDRIVFIELDDGSAFQFMLFGSSANVLLVNVDGLVVEAFQHQEKWLGQPAPLPSPAPLINTLDLFEDRWHADRKTITRALSSALPFFNATLAQEVCLRTGITSVKPAACSENDRHRLFDEAIRLQDELSQPAPRIYWDGDRVVQFSLIELKIHAGLSEEVFGDVDKALSVFIRRKLGQRGFDEVYMPLEKALLNACKQYRARLETMLTSMAEESRADRYERWGHLLMASQASVPARAEKINVPDLFEANQIVTIPLDPNLSGIANAQKYYDKARQTRQARTHAEDRLLLTEQRALEAETLLAEVQKLTTRSEVLKFEKDHAGRLAPFLGQRASDSVQQVPFRRFDLGGGYEVWVGKNAKQNDALTFHHARKFDFWLHARGVPGSHTVLRRPGRTAQPDKNIKEQAAAIAAYYSKAKGSHLVPVIMTERKYVRKPRGAAQGTVIVEKEEVLIVEPGLPQLK